MSLLGLLEPWAQESPDSPAVLGVAPGSPLTYGVLLDRVRGLGATLRQHGVGPSDVVLVAMPNGPDCLVAILGVMGVAVCAPMNPAYTLEELERLATDVRAKAVLVQPGETGPAAQLAARSGLTLITLAADGGAAEPMLPPQAESIALLLHTAGTTARPKQVPLSHGNLVAAARNVVASLQLTPADRCLNVMPLFHSHGLLGAALSTLAAGGSIVCTPGMDPRWFFEWAERYQCTWYTAASTIHRLVLEAPGEWHGFRFMRSASGPLPPQLARELERRCGAPMIEVFGMTEAYQIAANPLPPGERRFGSVGRATGTDIAILGDAGAVLSQGDGEILVRGPAVFKGYSAPAHANEDAFIEGWFRTGDLGTLGADGYLTITGRAKEQINRAGEKIAPREVEEVLLDHPGVLEAIAFGVPDPMLGEDIVAAVVLDTGVRLDVPAIRNHLAARLAAYKIPRRITAVAAIPKSDTGKPQRRAMSEAFMAGCIEQVSTGEDPTRMPYTTEARLARIWESVLGLSAPPQSTDRFFDLGGDSLAVMEMVVKIEDVFGVDLPLLDVHAVPTLRELAERIDDLALAGPSDSLLMRYGRGSGTRTVVLVPGQNGIAVGLDLVAEAIGDGISIYLFDYPGHRPGQVPVYSIEELAARLVAEIERADVVGRPLVLYGNSLGGWVALEAARLLANGGNRPALVGIGDMYSPVFNSDSAITRPPISQRLVNVTRRLKRRTAQARSVTAAVAAADATASARRRQVIVSNASDIARRAYRPHPYDGDLLVFATAPRAERFGATLGYERHVTGRITPVAVGGGHSEMHREQAALIGSELARHATPLREARDSTTLEEEMC